MTAVVEKMKPKSMKNKPDVGELITVGVDQLVPGQYQPRKNFNPDALNELANSIKQGGVIQPVVIRQIAKGKYELLAGERRWRAAQLAEVHDLPALLRECDDLEALKISLIENIQREDLNIIEEASALKRLKEEFKLTQQQVSEITGRSRSAISYMILLLDLEDYVQEYLRNGDLQFGHAKALLNLEPINRKLLINATITRGLTVRELENEAAKMAKKPRKQASEKIDPDLTSFEDKFGAHLGCQCKVTMTKSGSGEIIIGFSSLTILSGIVDRFGNQTGCDIDIKANPSGSGRLIIRFSNSDSLQVLLDSVGFEIDG